MSVRVPTVRAVNAEDLERQSQLYTGVPPITVDLLVEHGHLDTLVEAARAGDWFCAQRSVRELADRGQREQAWELLAPYVETGWWDAVREAATLLQEWRRTDDALELLRGYVGGHQRFARGETARLLASVGRVDEAIAELRPHVHDSLLLEALVEATDAGRRDAEVIALLEPLADQRLRTGEPRNAAIMLARVLDRAGRTDEATALLRAHVAATDSADNVRELAWLLARHDRFEELYALADRYADAATPALVDRLVVLDRADEAVAFLRASAARNATWTGTRLVMQLAELGRLAEAVEEAKPVVEKASCPCMLLGLLELLVDAERVDLALDVLDAADANPALATATGGTRPWLLSEAGRHEEALAAAQARSEEEYGRTGGIARVLEAAGRVDEAVALLEEAAETDYDDVYLARLLILTGRPREAVALHRARKRAGNGCTLDDPWRPGKSGYTDDPPF
ncbi:tetratricopeptide repeat protein [Yinghuangia soli]|uniref:Tetratricopeptide repeat protein n=1 Tax=Yinghuangia soli TaxID=2908204 RepID=A0AA41U0L3_9ACTN|nr:hypothetical protein [Yinghuangia soli]MCF2526517.1 hypothetical protein [Yinghuangia soli]